MSTLLASCLRIQLNFNVNLQQMHDLCELPQAYYTSPVVQQYGHKVFPYILYMDGICFAKRDTLLGLFVYNMVTGHRCLFAVLRKSELCQCGCRGWCTMYVRFVYTHCNLLGHSLPPDLTARLSMSSWRPFGLIVLRLRWGAISSSCSLRETGLNFRLRLDSPHLLLFIRPALCVLHLRNSSSCWTISVVPISHFL